jgi:predicted amino acid racemase
MSDAIVGNLQPGQRGYRALLPVGQLDTDVMGLTPVNSNYQVAGASSDLSVINLGDKPDGLRIGDTIKFRPNYSAFVRLMNNQYIAKEISPSLEEFMRDFPDQWKTDVPPAIDALGSET